MKKMRMVFASVLAALGLTAFGAGAEGLQAVEYLESTGVQWIDTGLNADGKLSVEIKCQFCEVKSGDQNILGAISTGDDGQNVRHHLTCRRSSSSSSFCYWIGKGDACSADLSDDLSATHVHHVDARSGVYSVDDGKPMQINSFLPAADCRANYYLFGRNGLNHETIKAVTCGQMRIYYARFWRLENGHNTLVGDFVPAVDANGAGCLYDYVSGQAFYDAGKSNVPFTLPQGRLGPVDAPVVTMSAVETSANSAHVRLTVVRAGGNACDVRIKYGLASDALTVDAPLVSGVGEGAAEGDLVGLQPEQTYYAALYGVCDDKPGTPSEVFSFRMKSADGHYPLPLDYEAVQCITVKDAGQYIDTKYKPTKMTDVDLKCEVPDLNNLSSIYWTRTGRDEEYITFGLIFMANNARAIRAYKLSKGTSDFATTLESDLSSPITYTTSGGKLTINGQTADLHTSTKDKLDWPIYIFGLNDNGEFKSGYTANGTKLHYLTLKEDGVPVRIFVPCKNEKGVVGLFERVNSVFYPNSGAGGSFGFDPLAEVETATLTVAGDPMQVGSPEPAYGSSERTSGQEIVAAMNVTAVTNYLTGEERYLEGWELTVRKESGSTVVTTSEGGDISKCPFTPEGGDQIVLRWVWSSDPYGGAILPDGYEPLDSLQFDGNDYLNTELLLSLDDQLVEVIDNVPGGQFAAFCTREYDNSAYVPGIPSCVLFSINGKWRFDYGAGQYDTGVEPPVGQPAALAVNAGGFYQNGELVYQADLSTGQAAHPLVLMASYWTVQESGEVVNAANFCQSNLQVLRVWDKDGSPKANLQPCRNTASGKEGLYDTVRQMFCPKFLSPKLTVLGTPANFANSGIVFGTSTLGAFNETSYQVAPGWHQTENGEASYRVSGWKLTVTDAEGNVTETTNDADTVTTCTFTPRSGENIRLEWQFDVVYEEGQKNAHIPQRYDEVEWIQFDGSTAIDTDYVPAPNQLKSQVRFTLDEGHDSNQMIFCARENLSTRSYTLYYAGTESGQPMSMTVGGTAAKFSSSAEVLGKRVAFSSDRNQVRIDGQDWTTVGTFDPAFALAGGPMTFGASYSGSLSRSDKFNFGWFKFHSAKFWEGGDLVRWFVPCHDKITNASGLYDVVTGTFYSCWKQLEEGPHAEQKGLKILFY